MVRWEVSRHPEWDMMYAAGLSAGEISRAVRAPRSTMQQHMVMREIYEPGTRGRHLAAVAARARPLASLHWLGRLEEAREFVAEHGRFPTATDTAARPLAAWLQAQRKARTAGGLTAEKLGALDSLGPWKTMAGQAAKDAHWRDRLHDLQIGVATHGRCPRYRRHTDEAEHTLGVWLHIQTQHRANETLPPWRLTALDTAFPHGWHSHE